MHYRLSSLLWFSLGSLSSLLILLALRRLMRPPQYVALPKPAPAPHPQEWCEPRCTTTGLPLVRTENGNEPAAAWEWDEDVHPWQADPSVPLQRLYGWPWASSGAARPET